MAIVRVEGVATCHKPEDGLPEPAVRIGAVELRVEEELISRTDQYVVSLRAYYAVDGSAEDAFTRLSATSQGYTSSEKVEVALDVYRHGCSSASAAGSCWRWGLFWLIRRRQESR